MRRLILGEEGHHLAGMARGRRLRRGNIDITLAKFLASSVKLLVMIFVIIVAIGTFEVSIAPFIAALGALAFGSSFR